MSKPEKRARKKGHRDEQAAARATALRRRRNARLAAIAAVAVIVVALGFVSQRDSDDSVEGNGSGSEEPRAEAACGAEAPAKGTSKAEYEKPASVLEGGVDYGAVLHTSCGDITVDLLEDDAPETVNSFVFLAREGFFDGLTWHRVIEGFVVQAGDPDGRNGNPPDGPGYELPDELAGTQAKDYVYGTVAMANSGPDTGGSQFFIVQHEDEPAGLDPLYTIFGRSPLSSKDVIDTIASRPTKNGDDPATQDEPKVPIYIESIEITEA